VVGAHSDSTTDMPNVISRLIAYATQQASSSRCTELVGQRNTVCCLQCILVGWWLLCAPAHCATLARGTNTNTPRAGWRLAGLMRGVALQPQTCIVLCCLRIKCQHSARKRCQHAAHTQPAHLQCHPEGLVADACTRQQRKNSAGHHCRERQVAGMRGDLQRDGALQGQQQTRQGELSTQPWQQPQTRMRRCCCSSSAFFKH
jgi:hypothetical protein